MISPTFLIKILGCTTVGAFLTIGVPVIAVKEYKASEDIARKKLFQELFDKHASPDPVTDQEFKTEISKWQPTPQQQKYLLDNWAANVHHLPESFFTQYYSASASPSTTPPTTLKDVCYLTIYIKHPSQPKSVHIPFLKDQLKGQDNSGSVESTTTSKGDIKLKSARVITKPRPSRYWPWSENSGGWTIDDKFVNELYQQTKPHLESLGLIDREYDAVLGWNIPLCGTDSGLVTDSIITNNGEHRHAPWDWQKTLYAEWLQLLE